MKMTHFRLGRTNGKSGSLAYPQLIRFTAVRAVAMLTPQAHRLGKQHLSAGACSQSMRTFGIGTLLLNRKHISVRLARPGRALRGLKASVKPHGMLSEVQTVKVFPNSEMQQLSSSPGLVVKAVICREARWHSASLTILMAAWAIL